MKFSASPSPSRGFLLPFTPGFRGPELVEPEVLFFSCHVDSSRNRRANYCRTNSGVGWLKMAAGRARIFSIGGAAVVDCCRFDSELIGSDVPLILSEMTQHNQWNVSLASAPCGRSQRETSVPPAGSLSEDPNPQRVSWGPPPPMSELRATGQDRFPLSWSTNQMKGKVI